MQLILWVFRAVILFALASFAVLNIMQVPVDFFFQKIEAPLVLILLAFFICGAIFGLLSVTGTYFRQRREISRLKRELAASEEKLRQNLSVLIESEEDTQNTSLVINPALSV